MMSARQTRVLRGAVAASIATFSALVTHMAAGGAMPSVLGALLPLLVALWPAVFLAGRDLSFWRLSVIVILSQALFHGSFVLGISSTAGTFSSGHHGHDIVLSGLGTSTVALQLSWGMVLGHALAAVVTIAAVYRGEVLVRAVVDLAQRAVRWLVALTPFIAVPLAPARAPIYAEPVSGINHISTSPLCRRGPPQVPAL